MGTLFKSLQYGLYGKYFGTSAGHPQSYQGNENYGNLPGKASMQAVPDLEEYFGTDTFLTEALTLEAIKALDAPIRNKQSILFEYGTLCSARAYHGR